MKYKYCPTFDTTCPYLGVNPELEPICLLDDPMADCDDYAFYNADEEEVNN